MSGALSSWASKEPTHLTIPLPGVPQSSFETLTKLSGRYFVAGVWFTVLVYSLPDFRLIHSIQSPKTRLSSLDVYGDTLITASYDATVRIWDLVSGDCVQVLEGMFLRVLVLRPTPGDEIASNSGGMRVNEPLLVTWFWGFSTFTVWRIFSEQYLNTKRVSHLGNIGYQDHDIDRLAAKGRLVATGGRDCTVRIWDIVSGECRWIYIGHFDPITFVELDQTQCYSLSSDGTLRVWGLQTGECHHVIGSRLDPVHQMGILPSYVMYTKADGALWVRDLVSLKLRYHFHGVVEDFRHDGHRIVAASGDTIKILDIQTGALVKDLRPHFGGFARCALIEGGYCIAVVRGDENIWVDIWKFAN